MERSRLGVLVCLILILTGLGLVVGIILYNQTSAHAQQSLEAEHELAGIFDVPEGEVREFWLDMDGQNSLHCRREASGEHWMFTEEQDLPVDQKKLDRYVSQLLRLGFSGSLTLPSDPDFSEYGLDYPTYQLRLHLRNGEEKSLLVGNRIPGSTLRYAILQEPGAEIAAINDSLLLLRKCPNDFYRSDLFALEDPVEQFVFALPSRDLHLVFRRTQDQVWSLEEPTEWPANQSQLTATLQNLMYLSVRHYVEVSELESLGVDTQNVLAELTLRSKTGYKSFRFYSDSLGNYYALQSHSHWAAELPDSIKWVLHQSVMFLLDSFPKLPTLREVEELQWNQTKLVQRDGLWYIGEGRLLSLRSVSRLEVWYNELSQRPLLSTHIPRFIGIGPEKYAAMDRLRLRDTQQHEYDVRWESQEDGKRVLWVEGQDTGFEVTAPNPLPDLKEIE